MFDQVQGDWPTHSRFILCSCDEVYLDRYFPRFYKTFTEHWSLPIHAHVIDPSGKSLERLNNLKVSHTYCETHEYDWRTSAETLKSSKPKFESDTMEHMTQAMYETYCQAQRFILLGHNMLEGQSVIVADVDAYALSTPNESQRNRLLRDTSFTTFNNRLMATFCHFHPKRRQQCLTAAEMMTSVIKESKTLGVDQKVIKQVFGKLPYTELTNGEWIRHWDVKSDQDRKEHNRCLVYHEKGTRGKNKPVGITWDDLGI